MKCPICKKPRLKPHELEAGLPASTCRKCGGVWISAAQYWEWLKARGDTPPESPAVETPLPVDVKQAKLCPDCGHILTRYKVWPNVDFFVDHCGHCKGVWFDRNEWDVVRSRNLHDDVHMFFTRQWQERLRAEETKKQFERIYQERFGEDYAELKRVRAWIVQHPKRAELLAYLSDRDPYRAISEQRL
jgi:Zn-finger nucleic acid-binding protein